MLQCTGTVPMTVHNLHSSVAYIGYRRLLERLQLSSRPEALRHNYSELGPFMLLSQCLMLHILRFTESKKNRTLYPAFREDLCF